MSEQFKPGDMVECVDASHIAPEWGVLTGDRYTVDAIKGEYLSLKEIGPRGIWGEGFWMNYRFRLIKPPATDISWAQEIVRKAFAGKPVEIPA